VGPITSQEEDLLVNEVLLGNGNLDLFKLSFMVLDHLIQAMKAIPTHVHDSSQDSRVWVDSPNGDFYFKSAYIYPSV